MYLSIYIAGGLLENLSKTPPPGIQFRATCRNGHEIDFIKQESPMRTTNSQIFSDGSSRAGWIIGNCKECGAHLIIDLSKQLDNVARAAIDWHPTGGNVIELPIRTKTFVQTGGSTVKS